jgi:hypothetical protein
MIPKNGHRGGNFPAFRKPRFRPSVALRSSPKSASEALILSMPMEVMKKTIEHRLDGLKWLKSLLHKGFGRLSK